MSVPRPASAGGSEQGFTLVELVVTLGVLMLVLGSVLAVFASAQRSQAFVTNRSESLDELRLSMDRIGKDVRQATSVDASSSATVLGMRTFVMGVSKHVTYTVTGTTLYRQEDAGAQAPVQTRLTSSAIFTYTPSVAGAQVIAILLQMTPKNAPDTVLQLKSELRLRNAG